LLFFSMQSKIIPIRNDVDKVEFLTPPRVVTFSPNVPYLSFGKDNLAPNTFARLGREVSGHRAILNRKVDYISGTGWTADDAKTLAWLEEQQAERLYLDDLFKRYLYDEFACGNVFIEIITDKRKSFLMFGHIEAPKVRLKRDGTGVIVNPDWQHRNRNYDVELPFYHEGFAEVQDYMRSVIWIKNYEPMFTHGLPSWYAGLRSVLINATSDEDNLSQLETGYRKEGLLVVYGVNSPEQHAEVQKKITKDSGAESAGGVEVIGLPSQQLDETVAKPELIDWRRKQEGDWLELHEATENTLLRIHNWFVTLSGFNYKSGFDTERMFNEYRVALKTVMRPKQSEYAGVFSSVLNDFGYNADGLRVENESPIDLVEPEDMLFVWEWRRDHGMEYDKQDTAQQKLMIEITR